MSEQEHKFSIIGVVTAWMAAAGAKAGEDIAQVKHFVCTLSISEWASCAALVYTLLQIFLVLPRAIKEAQRYLLLLKEWLYGRFKKSG